MCFRMRHFTIWRKKRKRKKPNNIIANSNRTSLLQINFLFFGLPFPTEAFLFSIQDPQWIWVENYKYLSGLWVKFLPYVALTFLQIPSKYYERTKWLFIWNASCDLGLLVKPLCLGFIEACQQLSTKILVLPAAMWCIDMYTTICYKLK